MVTDDSHPELDRDIGLLTNCPIVTSNAAQSVFVTWRCGLDVEGLRVQSLERMRRVFIMVLVAG